MICFDTSFIIDIFKQNSKAIEKYNQLKDKDIVVTHINIYEVWKGISLLYDENQAKKEYTMFRKFLSTVTIIDSFQSTMQLSGELFAELTKQGLMMDDLDLIIAGTCITNGCKTIITRNKKHFKRIKGLRVESY